MTTNNKLSCFSIVLCMGLLTSAVSSLALANSNTTAKAPHMQPITKKEMNLENTGAQRPVKLDLWYKTDNCPKQNNATLCDAKKQQSTNIAILSHGAMGAAIDYSWLAYPLAAKGWTVIGMNHYGESWRYGQKNIDPSTVTRFWQRTEDISFVIDSLGSILPSYSNEQSHNIVVIGHSSGGQTAAALAGVTMSFEQMSEYCQSERSTGDLGCTYAKKGVAHAPSSHAQLKRSSVDKRINRIIMLDPALGPAATVDSLSQVSIPSLVVGSLNNDFLPFEHHAKYYAAHMPQSQLVTLDQNEGHFVYLNKCDHQHKAQSVSLCEDRKGVNREQVHRQLIGRVFAFLAQ